MVGNLWSNQPTGDKCREEDQKVISKITLTPYVRLTLLLRVYRGYSILLKIDNQGNKKLWLLEELTIVVSVVGFRVLILVLLDSNWRRWDNLNIGAPLGVLYDRTRGVSDGESRRKLPSERRRHGRTQPETLGVNLPEDPENSRSHQVFLGKSIGMKS